MLVVRMMVLPTIMEEDDKTRIMSPVQEALNAITMVLPTAALLLQSATTTNLNKHQRTLLLGTAAHLPVSFAYHMGAAMGTFRDRLDNNLRRCDQAMQHVVCVAFAWALSRGCVKFAAMNAVVNAYFAVQVFQRNDGRRWIPIGFCTFLYTLPMIAADPINYAVAMSSMVVGGLAAFVPGINFGLLRGWGHSCVFHVALYFYARALGLHLE
jgi:hypothetical protein